MMGDPFDPLVSDADRYRGALAALDTGGCRICRQPVGQAHAFDASEEQPECLVLRRRRKARVELIARAFVNAHHPEQPNGEASVWFDRLTGWREAYPDLAEADLEREVAAVWSSVEASIQHINRYRHLDTEWDRRGWPPSVVAVMRDCIAGTA